MLTMISSLDFSLNSSVGQNSTSNSNYNGTNNYQKELFYSSEGTNVVCSEIRVSKILYHIGTSQFTFSVNQLTGFYIIQFFTFQVDYKETPLVYRFCTN